MGILFRDSVLTYFIELFKNLNHRKGVKSAIGEKIFSGLLYFFGRFCMQLSKCSTCFATVMDFIKVVIIKLGIIGTECRQNLLN